MLKHSTTLILLDILVLFIEYSVFYLVVNNNDIAKTSNKARCVQIFIIALFAEFMNTLNFDSNIRLLISMILSIIFYKKNYDVKFIKMIITPLIFCMILLLTEAIGISAVLAGNSISNVDIVLNNTIYKLEITILGKGLLITTAIVFKGFKLIETSNKIEFLYIAIPILTNVISLILITRYSLSESVGLAIKLMFVISILLLMSSTSLVISVSRIINKNAKRLQLQFLEEKVNMEFDYYRKIEENQSNIGKLYHDMKHYMSCIQRLCEEEDSVIEYLDNIDLAIDKTEKTIFNTGNKILDILLCEKNGICIKEGIDLTLNIESIDLDFIEMTDLCCIFSNALDNAIQACCKIKDNKTYKYISIEFLNKKDLFQINFENSKFNEVMIVGDEIKTDKENKFLHGIGIGNIKAEVQKYNGTVKIDYTDNIFKLNISIPYCENRINT